MTDIHWETMTQAARDAAYNNGAAFPDGTQLIEGWIKASALLRSQRSQHIDLPYGPRERNKWDLFPSADPNAPCLVFIHDGYWQRNSREMFANLIEGPYAHGWAAA